jgi:hypothetical protein
MGRKHTTFAHGPARLLLVAICLLLVLIPPLVQALHSHVGAKDADHCATCQTINSAVYSIILVLLWAIIAPVSLAALTLEGDAAKQETTPLPFFSRPPPSSRLSQLFLLVAHKS